VKWGEAAAVFAAYGWWRATGLARAGTVVANALACTDETSRMAAGILLVRAAKRSLPLLQQNLARGVAVALTLRVLGDIGGREAAAAIEPYTSSPDAAVAGAARDALRVTGKPT
jgi:hypothetical protein